MDWQGKPWQVKLAGDWKDMKPEEDEQIKMGYDSGVAEVFITARGQQYRISFAEMSQKNTMTAPYKERPIRHIALRRRSKEPPKDSTSKVPSAPPPAGTSLPEVVVLDKKIDKSHMAKSHITIPSPPMSTGAAAASTYTGASPINPSGPPPSGPPGGMNTNAMQPPPQMPAASSTTNNMNPSAPPPMVFAPTSAPPPDHGRSNSNHVPPVAAKPTSTGSSDSFNVTVQTLTGKTVELENITHDMTTLDVKKKVFAQENIPVAEQRLVYAGRQMVDDRNLEHYAVRPDSTITLLVKLS